MFVYFGHAIIAAIASHAYWFYFIVSLVIVTVFWFLYRDYKKLGTIGGM